MNEISTLISSVGFPIAACIGLGWFVKWQTENNNKTIQSMQQAINNNTKALQELIDKLDLCKAIKERD